MMVEISNMMDNSSSCPHFSNLPDSYIFLFNLSLPFSRMTFNYIFLSHKFYKTMVTFNVLQACYGTS